MAEASPAQADKAEEPAELDGPARLRALGIILLIVAAIFSTTALEAPFYFVDDRSVAELAQQEALYGVLPIHPDDVHIGAPWRYFGISVLWYIAWTSAAVGAASLIAGIRLKRRV